MEFLAVSGSLRAASTNTALLQAFADCAPEGIDVTLYSGLADLPIFNPDDEAERTPVAVTRWAAAVGAADGLIVACPEYAHGIPGGLKNALDWLVSRFEIPAKPVMLVHASCRSNHALDALREVLSTMSVELVDTAFVPVHLVGKSAGEVSDILAEPRMRREMARALENFRSAVAAPG